MKHAAFNIHQSKPLQNANRSQLEEACNETCPTRQPKPLCSRGIGHVQLLKLFFDAKTQQTHQTNRPLNYGNLDAPRHEEALLPI